MSDPVSDSAPLLDMPLLEAPRIMYTTTHSMAFVHLDIPRSAMMREFGPAMMEVQAALRAQGIATAGPLFAHLLKLTPEIFDFEVGFPVTTPIAATGRVQPGEMPAQRWLSTVYTGPYEGLPGAWGVFHKWLLARGLAHAEDFWEIYLVQTDQHKDGTSLRTQLSCPLVD